MPPIMANPKESQGHKDKYLDTSRKILSQEMLICNMKGLIGQINKIGQMSRSKGLVPTKRSNH